MSPVETLVAWAAILGGLAIIIGAVVYVVRLEGTTRVLRSELTSVTKWLTAMDAKVDQVLAAILSAPSTPPSARRRRSPSAGRGKASAGVGARTR